MIQTECSVKFCGAAVLTAVFKSKTEIVISTFFGMLLSKTNMKNSLTTKETISFYGLKDGRQGLTCKL